MKRSLFTVALVFASYFSNAQRLFEPTQNSWDYPNLSVETYKDLVITGFSEINPATGLIAPAFKITDHLGIPVTAYNLEYKDDVYLTDFTIRESKKTIILTGITAQTDPDTPHKLFVSEIDMMTGTPYQTTMEYPNNNDNMISHQIVHSEDYGQVTIVGTRVKGYMDNSNFEYLSKVGFVIGLDHNDFKNTSYIPIEMDLSFGSMSDYDILENITEIPGTGYFISGSTNSTWGGQNFVYLVIDYSGNPMDSRIFDNTHHRHCGSSVMYNAPRNSVYVLTNNSDLHQFQVAIYNVATGIFSDWVNHQINSLPIGNGVDQNGFRLVQTNDNLIVVGGYLSAPNGALPALLTPFQITMRDDLKFLYGKYFQSDNYSPLSPSYFEEDGRSVMANTPDMIAYSSYSDRTYLVNQFTQRGYDLHLSSITKYSDCEKAFKVVTSKIPTNFVGRPDFYNFPIEGEDIFPKYHPRGKEYIELCSDVALKKLSSANMEADAVIAPNPAKDQIKITLHEEENIVSVTVYDMKGSLVLSGKITDKTSHFMDLNIGNLDLGAYLVEITTAEGEIRYERFVKE